MGNQSLVHVTTHLHNRQLQLVPTQSGNNAINGNKGVAPREPLLGPWPGLCLRIIIGWTGIYKAGAVTLCKMKSAEFSSHLPSTHTIGYPVVTLLPQSAHLLLHSPFAS